MPGHYRDDAAARYLHRDPSRWWGDHAAQAGGVRTEKLWFNFTPDRVHWASFAGRDFTHRQVIKRKAANWARRYQAMPRAERLAVLAAIMAVEAEEPA